MKTITPQMRALLATRQFYKVDLYTLTLVDGTVFRYCSGDTNIIANTHTYNAGGQTGPYFEISSDTGGRVHMVVGLAADTYTVDLAWGSSTLLGIPFNVACRYGILDGGTLRRDVAIMPSYGDTAAGTLFMFLGRIAEVDILDQSVTINLNSYKELLNQQLPRTLFMPSCGNSLYDANCTMLASNFSSDASVGIGSTKSLLLLAGPVQQSGYYNQGKVVVNTGANAGQARSIKSWSLGVASLGTCSVWPPFMSVPQSGDDVTLVAGCNKSPTDPNGCPKFNNLANFRGFPDVPIPELSV